MKITIRTLLASDASLAKLSEDPKLTIKQRFRLGRFLDVAEQEGRRFEKARNELVAKFDQEDKDWRNQPPMVARFNAEYEDLTDDAIDMHWDPFKLADLNPELSLNGADFARLQWLIVDDETDSPAEAPTSQAAVAESIGEGQTAKASRRAR